ncbi:MAG: RNA polymerase sigma factor RpoD [Bacteroidia bacterium]|nr:MAG: RNA polymerase sigma factor RpoD [Bacteroidia bacterium]
MRQLKITPKITQRDEASLERYMAEVSKEEMITYHEEVELAKRIKQGDHEALNKLVRANLRFVISVAKQYQNQGLPLQDLITEGNIGLIKAAQRFDETKGFKFISYAVWWIRQSILQAIAEHSRVVRLPLNRISNISKVNKIVSKIEQEEERDLTIQEIAEECGLSVEEVNEALMFNSRTSSLDAPLPSTDDGVTLLDLLSKDEGLRPDEELEKESLRKDIERVLKSLPEREAEILSAAYGLNGFHPLSLDEIAKRFNLTKERVRQIKDKAIMKLKYFSKNKILRSYIA